MDSTGDAIARLDDGDSHETQKQREFGTTTAERERAALGSGERYIGDV